MIGDVEKMIAVGLVWGATNALMRRGAIIWDQSLKKSSPPPDPLKLHQKIKASLNHWLALLFIWQYSVPFLLNLSASATFFAILSNTPISLAVPVTNATTFGATAFFGMLLGEKTRVRLTLFVIMDHEIISDPIGKAGDVHQLAGLLAAHWVMLVDPFHLQALSLKRRNLAVKGALFPLVLTRLPCVA